MINLPPGYIVAVAAAYLGCGILYVVARLRTLAPPMLDILAAAILIVLAIICWPAFAICAAASDGDQP